MKPYKAQVVSAAAKAISALHFIMSDSTGKDIASDCQKMIDLLFLEFPNVAAKPQTK